MFRYGKQCLDLPIAANHKVGFCETAVSCQQMVRDQFFPNASISAMGKDVLLISNG
jgi:hypothetical protein